jgi:O-antigen biosynthesis protein WbqP
MAYRPTGKRVLDLALALPGVVLSAPIVLMCVLLVRATSRGPGVLRQTRVGKDGLAFPCYKLRTMFRDTPDQPSHQTGVAAITPVGAWLRRSKLDELPQLWNVVRGEMSLVGPRPCLPGQVELIEARRRLGVDALLPGITGVSQVAGLDMSEPERLAANDATYLAGISARRDLALILRTFFDLTSRRNKIADAVRKTR